MTQVPVMACAAAVPRGCGRRKTGLYAESALGPGGLPLEHFLLDPVEPLPPELDAEYLANKTRVWLDTRVGVYHLLSWIGLGTKRAPGYPHVFDIIEEIRLFGASRRLSARTTDLNLLTPGASRLILIHPRCLDPAWDTRAQGDPCAKKRPGHDSVPLGSGGQERQGPCLFKLRNLIPAAAGEPLGAPTTTGDSPLYQRVIGSTRYLYTPSGASDEQCQPARFAVLPLTGFCLFHGETLHSSAKEQRVLDDLDHCRQVFQQSRFPHYDGSPSQEDGAFV